MNVRIITFAIAVAALATLPFWVSGVYYINVSSQILFYAVFALGLNVLVGYAGLVSLGHAGLFGISAYATPICSRRAPATPSRSSRDSLSASHRWRPSPRSRCARPASVSS
jgi:ABC-type branched-subunit amino acid transport system permease subunit